MFKLVTIFFVAVGFALLSGCKPSAEQTAISEKYANALLALKVQLQSHENDASIISISRRFREACGRQTLVQPATSATVCAHPEAFRGLDSVVPVPPVAAEEERAAWDAYADEPDRQRLAAALSQQVEMSRQARVASIIARHWRSSKAIGEKARQFDSAVAASMGDAFAKRAPAEFALTALGSNLQEDFRRRLERQQALLEAIGHPAVDPLHEQTLADMSSWRKRLQSASAFTGDIETLRVEIAAKADNKAWDAATTNTVESPVPDGLQNVEATASAPPTKSAFDDFLNRAATLDMLRRQIDGARNAPPPQPLSAEAARQLAKDCRALMTLDSSSADEVCGAASPALQFALDLVERLAKDEPGGGNNPGAAPPPSPPENPTQGLSADLRARLGASGAATRAVTEKAVPAANIQNIHVEALKARIGAISRSYAQASVAGYLEQVARLEAQLEYVHEVMRIAAGGTLPTRLQDPLTLLSQADADAALRDVRRLQRIVARNLTLVPDAPELKITADVLEERAKTLESAFRTPATKADFAGVARKINPEKVKALLGEMPPKVVELTAKRVKSWSEKFRGLQPRFETWKGPRGPPQFDPRFPRSQRVLTAIELLGRNPTDAIAAFAALKAEHLEFYREVGGTTGKAVKDWEFGRSRPQTWMVSLLSPADLAVAAASVKEAARVPATLAVAEGWMELIDAAGRLQDAINAEAQMRREMAGRHPPGYPPKVLSTAAQVAERYAQEWDKRPAVPIEHQIRFQTAKLMYPNPTSMPIALREEIGQLVNNVINTEMARLDVLLTALYGSRDQDGLLDRAARSVKKLPNSEMAALVAGKQKAIRAAEIIAERVAIAESSRYVASDPRRWDRIMGWFGGFGRGPPPAVASPDVPQPQAPSGRGGAAFLFSSTELEHNFVELAAALDSAERNLAAAESIAKRTVVPPLAGRETRRAIADRRNWSDGRYSFDRMRAHPGASTKSRYPADFREWDGLWQTDQANRKVPFDFDRYVKNFTNFNGVGGGIHFGEVAATDGDAAKLAGKAAALSYDDGNQTLTLRLHTGQSYLHGPVDPRVLKALFAYVTSKPGVNLAVTIGAAGERLLVPDKDGVAVLLDPHFVDTRVGQDLYLADTIPWTLDKPTLPNGEGNAAYESFRRASDARKQEENQNTDRIVALLGPVKPFNSLTAADLRTMLKDDSTQAFLFAVASAKDPAKIKTIYEDALVEQEAGRLRSSPELDRGVHAVRRQASDLKKAGFSSQDIDKAIAIVRDGPLQGTDFNEILTTADRPARLAAILKQQGLQGKDLRVFELAAIFLGPGGETSVRSILLESTMKTVRKAAHQESEQLFSRDPISSLRTEDHHAKRVLRAALLAREIDEKKMEVRASKGVMRLTASAIMQIQKEGDKDVSVRDLAAALPATLYDVRGLATLFDEKVTFLLADEKITLNPRMRYRYATSSINVTSDGLTFDIEGTAGKMSIKARHLDELASAANSHIDEIARAYPPIARVREYAALAAFLRWSACPQSTVELCRPRDGLTIDFSALGRYDLRDRKATPTPDMVLDER